MIATKGLDRIRTAIRHLTYVPQLQAIARALGLRAFLRRWYYRLALPPDGVVSVSVGGIDAKLRAHTPLELRIIEGGGGELRILERILSVVREGDVVYDVGSNIGLYTVLLAKAVGPRGQVIAFEPDTENYAKLCENISLNHLTNVRPFRKALGERTAQVKIYKGPDLTDSSLIARPQLGEFGSETIEMADGDSLREVENLPVPRAVKVDVEGYEFHVLQGLRRTLADPSCELAFCEVHPTALPPDVSPQTVSSFLQSLGFDRIETDAPSGYPLFHLIAYKGVFAVKASARASIQETNARTKD